MNEFGEVRARLGSGTFFFYQIYWRDNEVLNEYSISYLKTGCSANLLLAQSCTFTVGSEAGVSKLCEAGHTVTQWHR